jgi:hypothetical protein
MNKMDPTEIQVLVNDNKQFLFLIRHMTYNSHTTQPPPQRKKVWKAGRL